MKKPKVIHYTKIPAEKFGPEAPGTSIRQLIGEQDGAPVYTMRMIEIVSGGHSPRHHHPYEHENYIIEGNGQVFINDQWYNLQPGDVVFVPPDVIHQYRNNGKNTFKFLCSIPLPSFQGR